MLYLDPPMQSVPADIDLKRLDPVATPPAWELVADILRHKIEQGAYAVGEQLPAERELADQLKVSRTVVRDALRALQYENLIKTRRGASGGPEVTRPPSRSYEQVKADLRQDLPQLENMIDLRIAIETFAARLAALEPMERKSEHLKVMSGSVDEMERALDDLDEALRALDAATSLEDETAKYRGDRAKAIAKFRRGDTTFHLAVASATRNPRIIQAIEYLGTENVVPLDAFHRLYHEKGQDAHTIVREHRNVLDAIKAGDGSEAAEKMWEHIESVKKALSSLLDEEIVTPATRAYHQLKSEKQQEGEKQKEPIGS